MSVCESVPAPSKALLLLESRALPEFSAFCVMRPWLSLAPRGDGHPVLVLPGLLADDASTRPLRDFLKSQGYRVHGWKLGRNCGLRQNVESDMVARVDELYERHGRRKISLIGWSLGGLYARHIAKIRADKVRCMISLGSPFAGSPRSTNAWQVYEWVSGTKVDEQLPLDSGMLADPPPVPTTSVFSRTDGLCAWRSCLNEETDAAENIEVIGSHCGLGHHPAAVFAVADRLAQPEDGWQKFDRSGWKSFVYPDWRRQ